MISGVDTRTLLVNLCPLSVCPAHHKPNSITEYVCWKTLLGMFATGCDGLISFVVAITNY